jgi:hypothetical protein
MFNHKNLSTMKKTIILVTACLIAAIAFTEVFAKVNKSPEPVNIIATFKWVATSFDFGVVKKDVPVLHEFAFVNTGSDPLVISSVQASCGCTVTEYTKEAIPAGGEGYVKATYSAASVGIFTKTITIRANTEEPVILTIRGEVKEVL